MATAIAGGVQAENVTLRLWNANGTNAVHTWYQNIFKPAFEAAHPGVQLELSFPSFSGDEFYDKLVVTSSAGTAPDVVTSNNALFIARGLVMPLNKLIAGWDQAQDFVGPSLQSASYGGQIYGIPLSLAPRTYVYNKRLFAEAGLDAEHPSVDWEGYRTAVGKLTRWASDGTLEQAGTKVDLSENGGFHGYVLGNGGKILNDDGTAAFNSPEAIEALTFWGDLFRQYVPPGVKMANSLPAATFTYQNSSMFAQARANNPQLLDDLAVAPAPIGNTAHAALLFGAPLGISSATTHPELAWELLKFHFRPDMLAGYNEAYGFIPPTRSAVTPDLLNQNPWFKAYLDVTAKYGAPTWAYASPEFQLVRMVLRNAVNSYYQGKQTAANALNDAARQWNQIVADNRK